MSARSSLRDVSRPFTPVFACLIVVFSAIFLTATIIFPGSWLIHLKITDIHTTTIISDPGLNCLNFPLHSASTTLSESPLPSLSSSSSLPITSLDALTSTSTPTPSPTHRCNNPLYTAAATIALSPPSRGEGHTALALPAAGLHVFSVDPALYGRPSPGATLRDQFHLDLTSVPCARGNTSDPFNATMDRAWSSPLQETDVCTARYIFVTALPPRAACYSLRLYLSQRDFSDQTFTSAQCSEARSATTLILNRTVEVTAAAAAVNNAVTSADAVVIRGMVASHPRGWCPGYYQSLPDDAWAAVRPSRVHSKWVSSAACTPSLPRPYFTAAAARACLADKWLAFIGDSTMEEVAMSALLLSGSQFDEGWTDSSVESGVGGCLQAMGFKAARMFDTASTRGGSSGAAAAAGALRGAALANVTSAGGLPPRSRVTMLWAGGATPCRDLEGLRAWENAAFVARVNRSLAAEAGTGRRPIVIVNSGLHDLGNAAPPFAAAAYERLLRVALDRLASLAGAPLIWKSSNPKTGSHSCGGAGTQGNAGQGAVDALNRAATRVLQARGAPFSLLDEAALLQPLLEEGEVFEHHCARDVLMQSPRSVDMLGTGCTAAVHELLHLVCPAA